METPWLAKSNLESRRYDEIHRSETIERTRAVTDWPTAELMPRPVVVLDITRMAFVLSGLCVYAGEE